MNKKQLAILLSKMDTFKHPNLSLEQYQTESEIAADALWRIYLRNGIKGKIIADLGCGCGIFGIGAAILGAKEVHMVDVDEIAMNIAKENKKEIEKKANRRLKIKFYNKEVLNFRKKVDLVIQNPPFGVKKSHTDKIFLMKAMSISKDIYSFHKKESIKFIERFAEDNNFKVKDITFYDFPLKKTSFFHTKRRYIVKVGMWHLVKD